MIGVSVISAAIFCGCGRNQATPSATQSTLPPTEWNNDTTKLSPFTRVQYEGEKVMVTYGGVEYELATINSLPVSDILNFCKSSYGNGWQRRFAEDLVPVLNDMGHPISAQNTVSLSLIDPKSGERQEISSAIMTEQNRRIVHEAFEASHPADENMQAK
jgi:hypothetical protein